MSVRHIFIVIAIMLGACSEQSASPDAEPMNEVEAFAIRWNATNAMLEMVAPRPSVDVIDRLEALLAQQSCIGSLDRWERHYTFSSRPFEPGSIDRRYDPRRIYITLREAGFEEFGGGRHIHGVLPLFTLDLDHREYGRADGEYDIATHTLDLWGCQSIIDD